MVARPHAIPCFSVAGDPMVKDVCWPLRGLYEALHELEGPNDGLVSVESALAFGTPLPVWPVDHLRQMNWLAPVPGMAVGPSRLRALRGGREEPRPTRLRRRGRPGGSVRATGHVACVTMEIPSLLRLRPPRLGRAGVGVAVRSSRTATVMSPSTFEVVRQRSRNQSIVSRTGILSAGSPTAAKISGRVTKLPEGMPPAPTLATSVVSDDDHLVDRAEVEPDRLRHEQDGRWPGRARSRRC